MFEQEYKKMFRDVKPSQNLEIETLGLLIEMRDHSPVAPAPKRRLKPIFITTAASIAAVFILTFIGIGVHNGMLVKRMESELSLDLGDDVQDVTEEDLFNDKEAEDEPAPEANDPGEDSNDHSKQDGAPSADDGTESDDKDSSADDKADSSGKDEKDPAEKTEEIVQEYSMEYKAPGSDNSAAMSFIYAHCKPQENNANGVRTYLSVKEFADALEKRSTPGYGTNYYNARELLIVPTKLPGDCCFLQLYLDSNTGAYSYQYALGYGGYPYLVTIENKSARATTLQELKDQINYLTEEEVQYSIRSNVLTYTFGTETVTVTVTAAAGGYEVTDTTCQVIFNRMDLGRATLNNEILRMTYPAAKN